MAAKKKTTKVKKPSSAKSSKGKQDKESLKMEEMESKSSSNKVFKYVIVLVLIGGLLYLFRSWFVVAIVNGKPITRLSVIKRLEAQGGSEALESIVTETLIMQAAEDEGVSVLPKEIDDKVLEIEQQFSGQGQDLQTLLAQQGLDEKSFRQQVKLQLIVERMFGDSINVTDEEVSEYVEQYAQLFGEEMSDEEKMSTAREQLKQQKISEQFYTWIQELQDNANINYILEY